MLLGSRGRHGELDLKDGEESKADGNQIVVL